MFQPQILNYSWSNFVYHHRGFTSIYRPLSYPFRSLYGLVFIYQSQEENCLLFFNHVLLLKKYIDILHNINYFNISKLISSKALNQNNKAIIFIDFYKKFQ